MEQVDILKLKFLDNYVESIIESRLSKLFKEQSIEFPLNS